MVHAAQSRGRMLHVLSFQRSFVLLEDIFLLGIVSVGFFLIVNLVVTCYSQVITTCPGLVCMSALSVRLDWGLEKYLMLQERLGHKRLFLHHHLFDWSSNNVSFSKASFVSKSLYFWHQAKPDQWNVWNILLCKLVPETYGHTCDIVPNISSGFAFPGCENINLQFWRQLLKSTWKWRAAAWEAKALLLAASLEWCWIVTTVRLGFVKPT